MQLQQALASQNSTCSRLIMANNTLAGNAAAGAGGGLYLTSPQGFIPFCGKSPPSACAHFIMFGKLLFGWSDLVYAWRRQHLTKCLLCLMHVSL